MNLPLKIVFVDDDIDDHFIFEKALKEIPIHTEMIPVSNGEKLMEYLSKNIKHLPDVIFLDLNMPRKNGSECLNDIKNNIKLKHLPVVVYSTSFHDDIIDLLYKYGAFHCIRKSSNAKETKKNIKLVLQELHEHPDHKTPREKFAIGFIDS